MLADKHFFSLHCLHALSLYLFNVSRIYLSIILFYIAFFHVLLVSNMFSPCKPWFSHGSYNMLHVFSYFLPHNCYQLHSYDLISFPPPSLPQTPPPMECVCQAHLVMSFSMPEHRGSSYSRVAVSLLARSCHSQYLPPLNPSWRQATLRSVAVQLQKKVSLWCMMLITRNYLYNYLIISYELILSKL